ncbi:hypothetical protein MMC07_003720 [Pseudocyphellaria aurata]|nr:hypothetical protein [Pseudocyphellaria aurata]
MAFFDPEFFAEVAKVKERLHIKKLEVAKAKGFSTCEEYEAFDKQQFTEGQARYEAFLDEESKRRGISREQVDAEEECKRRGISREQLDAKDPQRPPDKPQCNCDGHFNPFFCPDRLLSYNSMVEDPSGLLKYSHPPQIEQLHLKEDDKSNRLSEEDLEQYWGMDSQKWPRELPQWVRRDPVVKKITIYEIEHPSVPPSCSTESSIFTWSRSRSPTMQTADESNISKVASKDSILPHVPLAKLNSTSSPKASSPKMRKSKQQPQNSRIRRLPSHTMQTRSQDALAFYALDSCNRTISFRKARRTTDGKKRRLL